MPHERTGHDIASFLIVFSRPITSGAWRSVLALTFPLIVLAACSNADAPSCTSGGSPAPQGLRVAAEVGGSRPASGPADAHCGGDGRPPVQSTSAASCHAGPDAGVVATMQPPPSPRYNSEGDDDDCKVHLKYSVSTACEDTFFTVRTTRRSDGGAVSGAAPELEATASDARDVRRPRLAATEGPPGTYKIGPLHFDAPGRWTARFVFYPSCEATLVDSPLARVAFLVDVP